MVTLFDVSELVKLEYDNDTYLNWTNGTEEDLDFLEFKTESRIEAIVYCLLFLLAAGGNVPVLISLIKNRRRKSRIQNMILHLAIADCIVTFVMIPLEIAWRITVQWIAGDIACRIMLFLRAFGPYLSSMILVCISLDRYAAIVYPLRVNDAQRRAKVMITCAWVASIVCSAPQSVIFHVESHPVQKNFEQCVSFHFFKANYQKVTYNIFCVACVYAVPLLIIIFCYLKIMLEIRKRTKATNNDPPQNDLMQPAGRFHLRMSDNSHVERAKARTLKMTIIIIITFFCCWTPYVVIDLWYLFDETSAAALDPRVQTSLFMFAVFNSCVNPLVYGSYIFNFTDFLKRLCPLWSTRLSRQASALTRVTNMQVNSCHGSPRNHYRVYPVQKENIEMQNMECPPTTIHKFRLDRTMECSSHSSHYHSECSARSHSAHSYD